MAKILAQIEAANIGNIRLFAGDAAELLAWLPKASLSRIDLIHPDPWPKRRHWKRRFVQDRTIAAMARVLKAGGEFRFVCDIDDYCAWTLSHLARAPDFVWLAERADDFRQPWAGYTMTRYGRKAAREGARRRISIGSVSRHCDEKLDRLPVAPEIHDALGGRRHQAREVHSRCLESASAGVRCGPYHIRMSARTVGQPRFSTRPRIRIGS